MELYTSKSCMHDAKALTSVHDCLKGSKFYSCL